MEDKKYPIELEVITPLSIGAGSEKDWKKGLDYVQKDRKIYVLDLQKTVAQGVDVGRLAELFLQYDEKGILHILGNRLERVSCFIFNSPMSTTNNIKPFLRTQLHNKPLVAGSSLKGAIRSALFNHLRNSENSNEEVFGTMKEGTDFMRFIRVGDIEMPSTILVNSKIYNLWGRGEQWQGGWKYSRTNKEGDSFTKGEYSPQGFNTLYECVAPGQKGIGYISLAGNAYDLLERFGNKSISFATSKKTLIHASISELFKAINNVTRAYLKKERAFFEKYYAQRTDEIVTNIDNLLAMIPTDGSSCLLKMSAGVGFHSITGDWQFDDYDKTGTWSNGKKKYKSRKTVEYKEQLQLMGFVRLRSLAEEIERQKSLENERRIRLEAEQQRTKRYHQLLLEAQQLYDKGCWDDAIAKAYEAEAIGLNFMEHKKLIELCERDRNIALFKKEQEDNTNTVFKQPLAEVLKGKSSVGNIIGTTAKWIKMSNSFNEQEYQVLVSCLKEMPVKEIKKKRKDIEKAINKEWIDRIWNELNIT